MYTVGYYYKLAIMSGVLDHIGIKVIVSCGAYKTAEWCGQDFVVGKKKLKKNRSERIVVFVYVFLLHGQLARISSKQTNENARLLYNNNRSTRQCDIHFLFNHQFCISRLICSSVRILAGGYRYNQRDRVTSDVVRKSRRA